MQKKAYTKCNIAQQVVFFILFLTWVGLHTPSAFSQDSEKGWEKPPNQMQKGKIGITFEQVPLAGAGPDSRGDIAGRVTGIEKPDLYKIILYVHTDGWYVQPLANDPYTPITNDGRWNNWTHLGHRYAALVVKSSFSPPAKIQSLPNIGGDVIAKEQVAAKSGPKPKPDKKDQAKGKTAKNSHQTDNSPQNQLPIVVQTGKSEENSLIKRDGKDVLIHASVAELITNYDAGQPIYIAFGEPDGCGPTGNVWMQNPQTNVNNYVLKKEGSYFRAKDMVNLQFQIVQLKDNKAGSKNVKWARLERKSREMGEYYFNGFDCTGGQRTAIWLTESKTSKNGDNVFNFKPTQPLNERE